ncbi:hypothetical protein RCL1_007370 [Eukaryota sp. TZLM3-RCL]
MSDPPSLFVTINASISTRPSKPLTLNSCVKIDPSKCLKIVYDSFVPPITISSEPHYISATLSYSTTEDVTHTFSGTLLPTAVNSSRLSGRCIMTPPFLKSRLFDVSLNFSSKVDNISLIPLPCESAIPQSQVNSFQSIIDTSRHHSPRICPKGNCIIFSRFNVDHLSTSGDVSKLSQTRSSLGCSSSPISKVRTDTRFIPRSLDLYRSGRI